MQSPLFSIVVPIYKVEKYLERCVSALTNQTEKNIEILLVDDGSPDSCPGMCDSFAEKDNRIVVIHKPNGGLSDARNEGIRKARGQYVMFVDSDDYIDLDACERMARFVKDSPDIIVSDGIPEGAPASIVHSGIENNRIYSGEGFLSDSVKKGKLPMAAWLYICRREFLLENSLFFKKGIYHEDEEFTPRALLSAKKVINTGETYYHYIIRPDSITTKKDKRKNASDLFSTCESLSLIYDKLSDEELKALLKDMLVNKYLSLFQDGKLYQYGKEYLHKDFIVSNAYKKKTKRKAFLYKISPALYWHINKIF